MEKVCKSSSDDWLPVIGVTFTKWQSLPPRNSQPPSSLPNLWTDPREANLSRHTSETAKFQRHVGYNYSPRIRLIITNQNGTYS
jgi:hypothetical protein